MLLRPVMLAMRNLGTRVWILASRLRTRARISETIWTPLLFDVVLVVVVVEPLANELPLVDERTGVPRRGRRELCDVEGLYNDVGAGLKPDVRNAASGLSRLLIPERLSRLLDLLRRLFLGVET
jgi:hypothetical protein